MTSRVWNTFMLVFVLASAVAIVRAQHDARPSGNHSSHGSGEACGKNSQAAVDLIDRAAARLDKSKAGDASTLRAAIDEAEATLWDAKRKLADCVMLAPSADPAAGHDHAARPR